MKQLPLLFGVFNPEAIFEEKLFGGKSVRNVTLPPYVYVTAPYCDWGEWQ
jgi:hypothetical protein